MQICGHNQQKDSNLLFFVVATLIHTKHPKFMQVFFQFSTIKDKI